MKKLSPLENEKIILNTRNNLVQLLRTAENKVSGMEEAMERLPASHGIDTGQVCDEVIARIENLKKKVEACKKKRHPPNSLN